MITVLEREENNQQQINNDTDVVVASMPIPPGGVFMGFRSRVQGITIVHQNVLLASRVDWKAVIVSTGTSAMDQAITLDTLFDQRVPKDLALSGIAQVDEIKWDDAAVSTPFEEPGHINWNDMMELGIRPETLARGSRLVSLASGGKMPHVDTTDEYFPTFQGTIGSNKKVRVKQASYFLLALSSPNWANTTATPRSTIVDHEWSFLTYPDVVMDLMLPDILGISETGGESPFTDAAARMLTVVNPAPMENNTDAFHPVDWRTWTETTSRILTPGEPRMSKLSGKGR